MMNLDHFAGDRLFILQLDDVVHLVVGPLQLLPPKKHYTVCGRAIPDSNSYVSYLFMPWTADLKVTCPECERRQ